MKGIGLSWEILSRVKIFFKFLNLNFPLFSTVYLKVLLVQLKKDQCPSGMCLSGVPSSVSLNMPINRLLRTIAPGASNLATSQQQTGSDWSSIRFEKLLGAQP